MRTAVITGANGGIGTALTATFMRNEYRVIASDQHDHARCDCSDYVQCDLERYVSEDGYLSDKTAQMDGLLDEGGLHVLVNNAALQVLKPTESLQAGDWQRVLGVNVIAPFLLVRSLLGRLEEVEGSVVNITSIHATLTKPSFALYATSKSALAGLTRALAVDLGPGVRVNAIAPAATATPMLVDGFEHAPELLDELGAAHPLGRIAEPDEIASVAVFLASEAASFITGAVIAVDGGVGVRLHDPA